jgi:putative ABC transport system permease protein
MIKNYLVVAFRNLVKNRLFTFINILGLGIGLSVCIVAYFNHMFNYEFDRTHKNFSSIYRITSFRDMQGREQEYGIVPATLGLEIKKDIPGIDREARLLRSGSPVKLGENIFPSQISYVDPEFLKIFTFPMIMGSPESLDQQGNVLLSRKMAATLFGKEYPVGKSISIINDNQKEFTYTVSGVFEDLPENSSFRIDILTHFDNFLLMWNINDADWKQWVNSLFIQVNNSSLVPSITQALKSYLPVQNRAREDFRINRFTLIPLKDVGKSSRVIWSSGLFPSLHPAAVIAPPIMAIFILLIACFNFANTSIATFSKRLKEIGLRKTFGGQRGQLVTQFMIETLIVCFLALFAGILIAEFLVPAYSSLWSYMSIKLTFTGYGFFWIFLVILVLVTGFTAGVYPAIHVSSYNPASVLQGTSTFRGSGKLSAILLTLQFSISVMALIMGLVFAKNSIYQNTLDMGYDKNQLLVLPIAPENYNSLKTEIQTNPKVVSVAGTQNHIGFGSYRRPVKDADKQLEVDVMDIGPEYARTIGLRPVEGRLFDELRETADRENNSIIVNQKLQEDFGWNEGVGKVLTLYDTTRLNVIGVVKDFYIGGLWQAVEPAMLRLARDDNYYVLIVKASSGDLPGILEFMKSTWKSIVPNSIFGGRPQEELMQEAKDINNSILKVNVFLAIVATILSLIGMFNLVSLDIIRRTKEVGIRKIQGAPVPLIMLLISRKFLYILGIASVLGCIGGYYMSYKLLDSIWDYFVDIGAGILIAAVLILFVATVLTLIVKIAKAAMRNPAVSLRYQ